MKKKIALLSALITLSGCTAPAPVGEETITAAPITSVEQTTVTSAPKTEKEITTETSPIAVSSSQTSSSEISGKELPEDVIIPELSADDGIIISEKAVYDEEIIEQLGYDTPVDITALDRYPYAVEFAEALGETQRKALEERNYTNIILTYDYIGSERTDWLCSASYCLNDAGISNVYYERLFYIKDGKITENIGAFEDAVRIDEIKDGKAFMGVFGEGIYELDLKTDTLTRLYGIKENPDTLEWCMVIKVTDDFVIFSDYEDTAVKAYNRKSGDVTVSGIYNELQMAQVAYMDGDRLIYADGDDWYSFDMLTGETFQCEAEAAEGREDLLTVNTYSGNYTVINFSDFKTYEDYFEVKFNESGEIKRYYLGDICDALGDERDFKPHYKGIVGDKLYFESYGFQRLFVINLKTDKAAITPVESIACTFTAHKDGLIYRNYDGSSLLITDVVIPSEKASADILTDKDGFLTAEFGDRINILLGQVKSGTPYAALQDFTADGLPEIVIVEHNSGQGLMPCKIYDAKTLECIGELNGFCRDGYTRFLKTEEGVRVHNYYEHSVHLRYESYSVVTFDGEKCTESITEESAGTFNACGAINAGLIWEDPTEHYIGDYSEAEEYCVSSFGYDVSGENTAELVTELYNGYRKLELAYEALEKEDNEFNFFAMGDYDFDGKPEAFYQIDSNNIYFMSGECETAPIFESNEAFSGAAVRAYKVWSSMIVFVNLGNHQPCAVFTVENGDFSEIEEVSRKGQDFDHSSLYNGCYELIQSAYDCPSHTWKPYTYKNTAEGFREFGSVQVNIDDFLDFYGEEAQEIFDRIAAMETPLDNGRKYEVTDILYCADGSYFINYGWDICRGYYVFKHGVTEDDRLIDYTENSSVYEGNGVYLPALNPKIAFYPDSVPIYE